MKRVTQRNENGCGVASVATILGISYPEATKLFGKFIHTINESGAAIQEIRDALRDTYKVGRQRSFNGTFPNQDAIFLINRYGVYHWVVWDVKEKVIHDPSTEERYCHDGKKVKERVKLGAGKYRLDVKNEYDKVYFYCILEKKPE